MAVYPMQSFGSPVEFALYRPVGKEGASQRHNHRWPSPMSNFEDALKLICCQTVLCVGDVMLDDFVYGEVARISPEAPTPVLAVNRSELMIGGAGNVARNIAGLGARCILMGVIGDDDAAHVLAAKLGSETSI